MSLLLPSSESPVRSLFDVAHIAQVCAPSVRHQLPTLREARSSAAAILSGGGVKAVTSVVLRANGDIHLMQFGPRGGMRKVWNFGGRE